MRGKETAAREQHSEVTSSNLGTHYSRQRAARVLAQSPVARGEKVGSRETVIHQRGRDGPDRPDDDDGPDNGAACMGDCSKQ